MKQRDLKYIIENSQTPIIFKAMDKLKLKDEFQKFIDWALMEGVYLSEDIGLIKSIYEDYLNSLKEPIKSE